MGKRAMLSALVKARLGGWFETPGSESSPAPQPALRSSGHEGAQASSPRRSAWVASPLHTAATGYLLTPLCQQVKGF